MKAKRNLSNEYEKDFVELLIEQFKTEYNNEDRAGIYALTQRKMTYNSNKIEGSTLSELHTASLFDTGTLKSDGEIIVAKDIEEASGHFTMFNYMLETLEQPLSSMLIKEFHYKLKIGVFEDRANGHPVGEYKNRRNIVGGFETTYPQDVDQKIEELLAEYNKQNTHSLKDIATFHAKYEQIHPFQDGNGRTGRLIVFRECLVNNQMPVLIEDKNKTDYYYALNEMRINNDIEPLTELFKEEQSKYFELARDFVVPVSTKNIAMRIKDAKKIKEQYSETNKPISKKNDFEKELKDKMKSK